jgi:hypothetical protein
MNTTYHMVTDFLDLQVGVRYCPDASMVVFYGGLKAKPFIRLTHPAAAFEDHVFSNPASSKNMVDQCRVLRFGPFPCVAWILLPPPLECSYWNPCLHFRCLAISHVWDNHWLSSSMDSSLLSSIVSYSSGARLARCSRFPGIH